MEHTRPGSSLKCQTHTNKALATNKHAHAILFTHMSHTIMKLAQTSAPKLDFPKIAGPGSSNRSGPDCRNAE